jgi:hypothetical protein
MPTIKRLVAGPTEDALLGLKFKTQAAPALVTLAASSPTAGEDISFSVGSTEFLVAGEVNLEDANQSVNLERDTILFQEPVPPGEYFLRIPAVAADLSYLLIIEPVADAG